MQTLKDCSIVTATYELEEGGSGTVGIIGPKRMDYQKVVSTLKNLTNDLMRYLIINHRKVVLKWKRIKKISTKVS